MKGTVFLHCSATLLLLGTGVTLRAADDPAPPPGLPSREELREKLKGLTPAERQAKIKELRDKAGTAGLMSDEAQKRRAEFEKFRESVKDLPPAERATKLREWREKNPGAPVGPAGMTPEERQARRKEFSKRIEDQLDALKKKKADGTITEDETRRLHRMEQMAKRLETLGNKTLGDTGGPGLPPPRLPGAKPEAPGSVPAKPAQPPEAK
jgi:hypothetical protein